MLKFALTAVEDEKENCLQRYEGPPQEKRSRAPRILKPGLTVASHQQTALRLSEASATMASCDLS
jgi:hypothetical protein